MWAPFALSVVSVVSQFCCSLAELVASQERGYTQADVFSLQIEGKCKTGTWGLALELEA